MKNILITGCAGSLGKAFVRYLRQDNAVTGIDTNEWAVAEFSQEFPEVPILLMDFDAWRFDQQPCDILIHCAAHKHVNLGEQNPHTFINNNVEKTGRLFSEAFKHNVDILFISTDKAVEPVSTYGFTKALGEKLAWHYNGKVARLGNILASSGSVIPVWEKAIADGVAIPITDERMTRYMIEDSDAVTQIWGGFMQDEKLIVPVMKEYRILDLLDQVLERHGFERHSYPHGITEIGMREGEKMKESLFWPWEKEGLHNEL